MKQIIGLTVLSIAASVSLAAQPAKVWKSTTFLERVDGRLSDGGANSYVAADGSVRLINLSDLNQDGAIDLVSAVSHTQNQVNPLAIYWGKDGIGHGKPTQLPTNGGKTIAAGDLNGDGYVDLVVANMGWDAWRTIDKELDSWIYWGGPQGLSETRRTLIPAQAPQAVTIADIDGDGSADIVFANIGTKIGLDRYNKSYVYWGMKGRFDTAHRTILRTERARDVKIADLNGDSHPDVIFADEGNTAANGGGLIFWGGATRTEFGTKSTKLGGENCSGVAVGDLNGDGFMDIVLATEFHLTGREMVGVYPIMDATALDSYIYWGSKQGFSNQHRTPLPTFKAEGVEIGDLNGDGRPDIVFANDAAGRGGYIPITKWEDGGVSYVYWNGPEGFRANHRTALPTVHASACAIADLNGDGHKDVVFSNYNNDRTFNIKSFIYWGGADGVVAGRRAEVDTVGAASVMVADLDGDGKQDLVFGALDSGAVPASGDNGFIYWGNEQGEFSADRRQTIEMNVDAYASVDVNADGYTDLYVPNWSPVRGISGPAIFWGGPEGFSYDRRTAVGERASFHSRFADFNRDGYLDLVTSEWSPGATHTSVYWGGPAGFSTANRFQLKVSGSRVLTVADLNQDGWLDVIYPTTHDSGKLVIFWNGPNGFDNSRVTLLPNGAGTSARVADLNRDGFLDIVVANLYDPHPPAGVPQHFGGSPKGKTDIWWGGKNGYSLERHTALPTNGNEDVSIADLNNDGYLDLALSAYSGSREAGQNSFIYWNGPNGFDPKRVTALPTYAASGVMIADYNRDGYKDVRFANHVKDGDHGIVNTFIYWNSKDGFSKDRRQEVFAPGNHLLTAVDIGNVYDRSDRYDYISPAFDSGAVNRFEAVRWEGETPFRTKIEFAVRAAATRAGVDKAAWTKTEGGALSGVSGRWVQYKATLISPDDANSPVLRGVTIEYR